MGRKDADSEGRRSRLEDAVVAFGRPEAPMARPTLVSHPVLEALRKAGTAHVYADTADTAELGELLAAGTSRILAEVDGNTANQPLVHKVIGRYLAGIDPATWANQLGGLPSGQRLPMLYAVVCGRLGNDMVRAFASGRAWEVSLQLHMGLGGDAEGAVQVGRLLRRMVPTAFVKVPFTPQAPACFLVARDLEREGIPVNFTSTFSARQAVAAALLADVARTNIFMGRLNEGLHAERLGEHVTLEAQRALARLRREAGTKTQLIVASMRDWRTFVRTAGCDVYTAPCGVIRDLLAQEPLGREGLPSQLATSSGADLEIAETVTADLGAERIARLYRVEPELVAFLREFRATTEYRDLRDPDQLFRRCEAAGFGDLFYAPDAGERRELRLGKLPTLGAPLTKRLPLDTLYTLLADADFHKHQEDMDREMERRFLGSSPAREAGA